jgi:5-formyltetrahydrofolate cyclo-ligase
VCHRVDPGDALVRGAFGLLEPDPAWPVVGHHAVELWVVPGVGFDRAGGRLGRGGGYYDAALASSAAPSIGVCFAAQLVDVVPSEPHDRPVRRVVVA